MSTVREHWPRGASFTVGFLTHSGTVMAAGSEVEARAVRTPRALEPL